MKDYALTEKRAGYDWIDGRPVFFKTVAVEMPNNETKSIPHGITGLEFVHKHEFGAMRPSDGAGFTVPHVNTFDLNSSVQISWNPTHVILRAKNDNTSYTYAYVTLFYVKTAS